MIVERIDNGEGDREMEQKVREPERFHGQMIQAEKFSVIGELVLGMGHEINNLLTSVIGFTQLLSETAERPRDREFLGKVFNDAMRCSEIVQNLLSFARQHPVEKRFEDLKEVVEKALEWKRYQMESDGIDIEFQFSPSFPRAWIDSHRMEQAFFNIVHNAHQALLEKKKRSAGPLRFTVSGHFMEDRISVSFGDTGTGITLEALPKVFEPFFTTKEVGIGTGLGLSISYGIVKEHGGEIFIENHFGEGATFIVTLPVSLLPNP